MVTAQYCGANRLPGRPRPHTTKETKRRHSTATLSASVRSLHLGAEGILLYLVQKSFLLFFTNAATSDGSGTRRQLSLSDPPHG